MSIENRKNSTPKEQGDISQKNKPVHMLYGDHSDEGSYTLSQLDAAIERQLRKTKGAVVVLVESGDTPTAQAKLIERLVEGGLPPSQGYGISKFMGKNDRMPRWEEPQDMEVIRKTFEEFSLFSYKEMTILDKYVARDRRVRVLWEDRPQDTFTKELSQIDSTEEALIAAIADIEQGNFDSGLTPFKRHVETFAKDIKARDVRLAERVDIVGQDAAVESFVGFRGSAHSQFTDLLEKEGYAVTATFLDKTEGGVDQLDSPFFKAVKQKVVSPDKDLSEIEWYRAMVGEVIAGHAGGLIQFMGQESDEQTAINLGNKCLSRLSDMKSIRKFERKVKQYGFLGAMLDDLMLWVD